MRHEVPVAVPDAFLYVERDGRRVAVVTPSSCERIAAAAPESRRCARALRDRRAASPAGCPRRRRARGLHARLQRARRRRRGRACDFPLELADHLRANGIEVSVDRELFEGRRRSKTPTEIAGLRRAQRACEAALDVARDMLRERRLQPDARARRRAADVRADQGRDRARLQRTRRRSPRSSSSRTGRRRAIGHDIRLGPDPPGEAIVFDLFPRDRETGVYSDMTRTYVVGDVPTSCASTTGSARRRSSGRPRRRSRA